MTVASATVRTAQQGNGSSKTFTIPFLFFSNSDIKAYRVVRATGVATLQVLTTNYTLSGAGVAGGGTLTIVAGDSAPATTEDVVIYLKVPLTQLVDYLKSGPMPEETVERSFDLVSQGLLRIDDQLSRAVILPDYFRQTFNPVLPDLLPGNRILATNTAGTGWSVAIDVSQLSDISSSVTAAAASASSASSSASSAAASASAASTSATAAASSATAAATSATNAATSATSAASSATTATTQASAASTSATNAASSATSASSSASSASTSATNAASSATSAASSATTATTQASNASTSATNAAGSATSASTSATNAASSATSAATSATNAANAVASIIFRDIVYLTSASSPYNASTGDKGCFFSVDCTSGAVTINLPAISGCTTPWTIAVKKTDSSANSVTINRNGTDTIEGATSKTLDVQGQGVWLVPDTDKSPDQWGFMEIGAAAAGGSITLAMLQTGTQGNILHYTTGGAAARLAVGAAGQYLKSGGAAADVSWSSTLDITSVTADTVTQDTASASVGAINLTSQAAGDILEYNSGWKRLGIGSASAIMQVSSGHPAWTLAPSGLTSLSAGTLTQSTAAASATAINITSEAQGDVLYRGASGWNRLGQSTAGKVLRTEGAAANPTWGYPAGLSIASQAQGDILYFDGTNWVRLAAGTSGNYLKTLGTGANPTWAAVSAGGGKVLQVVNSTDGTLASTTTTIPYDNTIPQNTEGGQFLSLAITPQNASSKLVIFVTVALEIAIDGVRTVALFQDSTANALAAIANKEYNADVTQMNLIHYMSAPGTSTYTFKVRAGGSAAGTLYFNGQAGTQNFTSGTCASSITIFEIGP